jgi:hypothetical protein
MQVQTPERSVPNVRADAVPVEPGWQVNAVNTRGGLAHDRLAVLDRLSPFLPVGFYYKAFHSKRLFPRWERMFRRLSGASVGRSARQPRGDPEALRLLRRAGDRCGGPRDSPLRSAAAARRRAYCSSMRIHRGRQRSLCARRYHCSAQENHSASRRRARRPADQLLTGA